MKSDFFRADFSTRGYFVRYPLLANACVLDFVNDFQDQFAKDERGRYVLKKKISESNLKQLFFDYLCRELIAIQDRISKDGKKVFKKILVVADSGFERRKSFAMVEQDIDIGLEKIETTLDFLFNRFFTKKRWMPNVVWCKHNQLLSEDWEKILQKKVFGKKNFDAKLADAEWLEKKKICIVEKTSPNCLSGDAAKNVVDECVDYVLESISFT